MKTISSILITTLGALTALNAQNHCINHRVSIDPDHGVYSQCFGQQIELLEHAILTDQNALLEKLAPSNTEKLAYPLYLALDNKNEEAIDILVQNANTWVLFDVMDFYINKKNWPIVEKLIAKGVTASHASYRQALRNDVPLEIAQKLWDWDNWLIQFEQAKENAQENAYKFHWMNTENFLHSELSFYDMLRAAFSSNREDIGLFLAQNKENLNGTDTLRIACEHNSFELAKLAIQGGVQDFNFLEIAISPAMTKEFVEFLLANGLEDFDGALHWAAYNGDLEMAISLEGKGATNFSSAFNLAIQGNQLELAQYLLPKLTQDELEGAKPLEVRHANIEVTKEIHNFLVENKIQDANIALVWAAHHNDIDYMNKLIEEANYRDSLHYPLRASIKTGSQEAYETLLALAESKEDYEFFWAAKTGDLETVKAAKNGVSKSVIYLASEYAAQEDHKAILLELRELCGHYGFSKIQKEYGIYFPGDTRFLPDEDLYSTCADAVKNNDLEVINYLYSKEDSRAVMLGALLRLGEHKTLQQVTNYFDEKELKEVLDIASEYGLFDKVQLLRKIGAKQIQESYKAFVERHSYFWSYFYVSDVRLFAF